MEIAELKLRILLWVIRTGLHLLSYISMSSAGRWALRLFTKPRRGRLSGKDRQFLSHARWESAQCRDLTVRYYVWENSEVKGPVVLLAHGWESNTARWRSLIRHIQPHSRKVIALDAPAHGDSEGEVFSAVVYAEFMAAVLQKEPCDVIIGHSAGGMALTFLLYDHPVASIKKVALLGTPYNLESILQEYARYIGYSKRISEAMHQFIERHFGYPVSHYSVEEMAKSMNIPCLIIHDVEDRTTSVEGARRIHRNWNNSVLIETNGLGHGLQGNKVYVAVSKWLQEDKT